MDNTLKKIGEYFIYESEVLGKGAYGKVFKGYHENNPSKLLAIKQINVQIIPESYLDEFKAMVEKEVNCLQNLDHPNIIKLDGVRMTRNNLYLATELCQDGNFSKIMGKVPVKTLLIYFKQIIQALVYAKSIGAIHRDIKPENILMKDNMAKVCDFGFSKFVDDPSVKNKMTSKIGTPLYMAPEVFADEPYSCQCDVWSCGVMLYQMIYAQTPWMGMNQYDLFENVKNQPLKFPPKKDVDEKLKDLIGKMLDLDQDNRISLEQVLKHECMVNVDEKDNRNEKQEEEVKYESNFKKKKEEVEVKNDSNSKRKKEFREDDKKASKSQKEEEKIEKNKDSNIKQQKSNNMNCGEEAKGGALNPKKNKSKEEIPKYILYLEHKANFFNELADRLLDYKEHLNLSGDIRRQMRILFKKIALISAKRIKKIVSLKKKEKMSEIKQVSMDIFESGVLRNLKSKYEEFLEKHETSFQETLEEYKKSIKKFPPSFIENVVNSDLDELNLDFIKEYKRIFDGLKDEIDEKIEDLEQLDGEEHNEVFKTIFCLIKVKRGGKLEEEFEFNEDDEIDSFEEFNKQIEKMKKAKEKSLKQLRSLMNK